MVEEKHFLRMKAANGMAREKGGVGTFFVQDTTRGRSFSALVQFWSGTVESQFALADPFIGGLSSDSDGLIAAIYMYRL